MRLEMVSCLECFLETPPKQENGLTAMDLENPPKQDNLNFLSFLNFVSMGCVALACVVASGRGFVEFLPEHPPKQG